MDFVKDTIRDLIDLIRESIQLYHERKISRYECKSCKLLQDSLVREQLLVSSLTDKLSVASITSINDEATEETEVEDLKPIEPKPGWRVLAAKEQAKKFQESQRSKVNG